MFNFTRKKSVRLKRNEESYFITFNYNARYVDLVKTTCPVRAYHPNTHEWEVDKNSLIKLQDTLDKLKIEYQFIRTQEKFNHEEASNVSVDKNIEIKTEPKYKSLEKYKFKSQPYEHQITGILYGLNNNKFLLADEMGCVDEDTIVQCRINRSTFKYTLKQAFDKFKAGNWNSFSIRCLKDDYFGQNKVNDIIYTGKKETFKLTLESNKFIIATGDHEILTKNGYKRLDSLSLDDFIIIRDKTPKEERIKSIEPAGIRNVYDIKMEEPYRNFVANGIVVHNCGKSLQTLDIATIRKQELNIKHCFIIVGYNTLKENWLIEIEKHTFEKGYILGTRYKKDGTPFIGSVADRLYDLEHIDNIKEFFIITNIETLRYHEKYKKNIFGKVRTCKRFIIGDKIEELCKLGKIGMVIFDEWQKCKSITSEQTKGVLKIKSCPFLIAATGTPIMNKPEDSYTFLKWLGADIGEYRDYLERYCVYGGFQNKQIVGHKNLEELHKIIKPIMLRRKKDILNLPDKVYIDEVIEMSDKQRIMYKMIEQGTLDEINSVKFVNLTTFLRLRQVTSHPSVINTDLSNLSLSQLIALEKQNKSIKFDRLEELLETLAESNEKAIIFSNFSRVVKLVEARFQKYNPLTIIGDIPSNERMRRAELFQNNPDNKIIVGTIGAMGTGITLTAASHVIFIDQPWNKALEDQASDRAHRIGQKSTVFIHRLLCKDTIDPKVNQIVQTKGDIASMIVDGAPVARSQAFVKLLFGD